MANLMDLRELEAYISEDETLRKVYSGEYLPEVAQKWFGREGVQTREAAVEMAQRGAARQNVRDTFSKIEIEAKKLGLEVRYDVNRNKNEIIVVFVDRKGVVASESLGLGTFDKTLKTNMAAPKSFAPHISDRGTTLLTQTEEVALSFLETLKKTAQIKTNKIDKRDFLKTQLRTGKKAAEMSVVTSETHSVIDEDEFNIEDMYASSRERDAALHTKMRVGGIIGEVSKGIDFLSELRKKKKVSEQQARAKNERIDQYLTRYVAMYQQFGKEVAEEEFYNSMMNEELDLTEEQLKTKMREMETRFGKFLEMKSTFGLSKDEAFSSKKFSYAGTRSAAFRSIFTTGRHLDQVKNYLEKSGKGKRLSKERLDEIFVSLGEDEEAADTEHKLYSRALIEDENVVLIKLKESIEEEIKERQSKFMKTKKYKKMSEEERKSALKKIEDDIREKIPEVNAAILEDMGLTKESVMKEQESERLVTGVITDKEFQKYREEAVKKLSKDAEKKYGKLSEEEKAAQTKEDFINKYISSHKAELDRIIAGKATGRKNLASAEITQWMEAATGEIGYNIEAKEIIGGDVGKLLWLRTGLRETARGIDDKVFNRLTQKLGVEGTDVIGLAKKIKVEEIPGYVQAILTQEIVNATNEKKIEILKKLQELGFRITEKNGKYYVDNSMEVVEGQNWEGLIDYLTKDLKVFEEEIDAESGEKTYKFAKNAQGYRSLQIMDVANRADVWEPTKDVKLGYKEAAAALREVSAAGLTGAEKEAVVKDLKIIYDPTQGRTGGVAQRAQADIDAILNQQTGSIVQTYRSKSKRSRKADVGTLKEQSYKRGEAVTDKDQTYIITIGNGSGYTINVNDLLKDKAVWDKSGGLTEEEYQKTIWGVIDSVKKELIAQGISPENIQVAIDPGTDFGFEMYGQGAVGRFIYLPNVEADVRYEGDEAIYSLPEYSQDVTSLLGSMKRGVKPTTVKPKAQAAVQKIFYAGQSEKSALGERAYKKRFGASKAGKVTEISRSKINELIAQGDIEAAERLMSGIWVSRQAGLSMLLDRDKYTTVKNGKEVYNQGEQAAFLTEALRYLKGGDILKTLYGSDEDLSEGLAKEKFNALDDTSKENLIIALANEVANAITDTAFTGKVKGLSGIANRFPSLQRHAALFGEMLIGDLEPAEIRMGPAMTKILNGDYDGDTVNFILGLWSNGMSFDAAAKLVERQKKINRRFYDKMLVSTAGSDTAFAGTDVSRLKDAESMGLSALATKFNKPFTGIFSNMSTRIREGLKHLGRDYIDESGNVRDLETVDDYVDAINTELVTAVGQILEQDSISAKKVDERIAKRRATLGTNLSDEEKRKIELEVLNEFKDLESLIRDPKTTYEQVIKRLEEMGLLGDDVTQISASVTSIIEDLIDNISDETKREEVLKRVGLTKEGLSSGKISAETYLKAGRDLESTLYDKSGKQYKIFSGEYGSGLAVSRMFTPSMKGDSYQMIKFLTQTNDILRETGEIIDENKSKFNEYGEVVGKAKSSLEGEIEQESAKVIIAGKEGRAIERNVDAYKNLANKLEEAGSNYKAINRLSTTELKERLLPYAGLRTTGLDPKTLKELIERVNKGETFSKDELIAAFGVKDKNALNSLFMGALSTLRGDYIHNIAQGDKAGQKIKGKSIFDLLKLFGYSDEQIKDTFDIYRQGALNARDITQQFGKSMGAEIPFVGMTSDGQFVVNARADELFYKQRPSRYDENKMEDVVTIVDYKTHANGKLLDEDIAQGIIYKTFLEDIRDFAKSLDKNITDEEAAELFKKQIRSGLKYTSDEKEIERREEALARITPNVARTLRSGATIETSIVVIDPATGAAQAYAIGSDRDKYKQIQKILLSGDTSQLTTEERAVLKGGARQLTSADYFKPGVSPNEKTSIETRKNDRAQESTAERSANENEYNQLLTEQFEILNRIVKVKQEIAVLNRKEGDTTNAKTRLKELQEQLDTNAELRKELEDEGIDPNSERFQRARAKLREKLRYNAADIGYEIRFGSDWDGSEIRGRSSLTVADYQKNEAEYQRLLNKRLTTEKQIGAAQHEINVSTSAQQKANLADVIVLSQKELGLLDEQISKLTNGNNLRKEQKELIDSEYKASLAMIRAQESTKKQGANSLWDVMRNDMTRAAMRITDFSLISRLIMKLPQDIQRVVQYARQLDEALVNLRIASGLNYEEGQKLILTYNKLAKSLSATTTEVAAAGDSWLRQGYAVEETTELIEASMKLSKLGQMESAAATKALTSAMKGFKLAASDAMSIVDRLTKVDMEAAVSAGDIAEGLSRVSTSAQLAGLDMDQTIGILSTIGEVTQRDLGSVGDSLRTLLSRYGNVKAGVFTQMGLDDDGETSDNINDIEKVLGQLGIKIRSSSSDMRNISDVLDELATKWNTLDTVSKNAIATAFAGVRQRENFLVMMENWDRVKELTDEAADSAGTADEKYKAYTDSLAASTKRLESAWENLSQKFETSAIVKFGTDFLAGFVENLGSIVKLVTTLAAVKFSGKIWTFLGNTIVSAKGAVGKFKNWNTIPMSINDKGELVMGGATYWDATKNQINDKYTGEEIEFPTFKIIARQYTGAKGWPLFLLNLNHKLGNNLIKGDNTQYGYDQDLYFYYAGQVYAEKGPIQLAY